MAPDPTERPQFSLMQRLTSPSTDLSLDVGMDSDSWLDYIPFDDNESVQQPRPLHSTVHIMQETDASIRFSISSL